MHLQGGGGGTSSGDNFNGENFVSGKLCRKQTFRSLKEHHLCTGDTQGPNTHASGTRKSTGSKAWATAPSPGRPTPGSFKQDKSSGGSVDTTKTRLGPQGVRMSSAERPIGAAKGTQSDTEALCPPPPPVAPPNESRERLRRGYRGRNGPPKSVGRSGKVFKGPTDALDKAALAQGRRR